MYTGWMFSPGCRACCSNGNEREIKRAAVYLAGGGKNKKDKNKVAIKNIKMMELTGIQDEKGN